MNSTSLPLNGTALSPAIGDLLSTCGAVTFSGLLEKFGWTFYLINPKTSSFLNYTEVPNYAVHFMPVFLFILLLEQLIRFCQKKSFSRSTDLVVNIGSGFFFVACKVALLGVVMKVFTFLYTNYRLVDLPPQALSTWLFSLLLVEFVYYWVHRSLHEIHIFWAGHQFHHNAVQIDVTTTIRDSVVDLIIYEFFPAPLALLIPPPILLVHMQFSLLYQIWLHTEVVGHLGPLEYLINTPRQHRVHHGRNRYCIDKNYGALLMIWDRLFGTYQSEDPSQKMVFGTTSKGYQTFDAGTLNFYYYYDVLWAKFRSMDSCADKMKALFYGPGWSPGKPRTGLLEDIPEIDEKGSIEPPYDCEIPFWASVYVLLHSGIIGLGFYILMDHPLVRFSPLNALLIMLYILFALTTFGAIFDQRSIAPLVESFRCALFFLFDAFLLHSWIAEAAPSPGMATFIGVNLLLVRFLHGASILVWMALYLRGPWRVSIRPNTLAGDTLKLNELQDNHLNGELSPRSVMNQRNTYQMAFYAVSSVVAVSLMLLVMALRHPECSDLLQRIPGLL